MGASLLVAPVFGWMVGRWWAVAVAALLPVVDLWVWWGLDTYTRDGYENWGLIALPFLCGFAAGLAAVGVALRRRRTRRAES